MSPHFCGTRGSCQGRRVRVPATLPTSAGSDRTARLATSGVPGSHRVAGMRATVVPGAHVRGEGRGCPLRSPPPPESIRRLFADHGSAPDVRSAGTLSLRATGRSNRRSIMPGVRESLLAGGPRSPRRGSCEPRWRGDTTGEPRLGEGGSAALPTSAGSDLRVPSRSWVGTGTTCRRGRRLLRSSYAAPTSSVRTSIPGWRTTRA
jgi:hypothetical protein